MQAITEDGVAIINSAGEFDYTLFQQTAHAINVLARPQPGFILALDCVRPGAPLSRSLLEASRTEVRQRGCFCFPKLEAFTNFKPNFGRKAKPSTPVLESNLRSSWRSTSSPLQQKFSTPPSKKVQATYQSKPPGSQGRHMDIPSSPQGNAAQSFQAR